MAELLQHYQTSQSYIQRLNHLLEKAQKTLQSLSEPSDLDKLQAISQTKHPQSIDFEDAVSALEITIEKLKNERTSLEDTVKLYAEGLFLQKICQQCLETAKERIELVATDENGQPLSASRTQAFDQSVDERKSTSGN